MNVYSNSTNTARAIERHARRTFLNTMAAKATIKEEEDDAHVFGALVALAAVATFLAILAV